jgi:hypothetical protein
MAESKVGVSKETPTYRVLNIPDEAGAKMSQKLEQIRENIPVTEGFGPHKITDRFDTWLPDDVKAASPFHGGRMVMAPTISALNQRESGVFY